MVIKIIVMLMVVLGSAYNVVLNIVRYRSASNHIPDTVSDVYDYETYLKWKRYSAEHCRLNFVFEIISCIAALVLLAVCWLVLLLSQVVTALPQWLCLPQVSFVQDFLSLCFMDARQQRMAP